jgi:hypothetical protein
VTNDGATINSNVYTKFTNGTVGYRRFRKSNARIKKMLLIRHDNPKRASVIIQSVNDDNPI